MRGPFLPLFPRLLARDGFSVHCDSFLVASNFAGRSRLRFARPLIPMKGKQFPSLSFVLIEQQESNVERD